ncbi:MAG: BatD family protein [Motiliproteus sp.]
MKYAGYAKIFLIVTMLALALVSPAQAETLTAFVDRNKVAIDETLQLSVRIDSQAFFGKPEFSLLEQDFDILGTSQSRQLRSINGKSESSTQWELHLAPKREGQLKIPSFEFKGARSQEIDIRVSAVPQATAGNDRDYYLEMEVDKHRAYVQEQLLVRIRLNSSIALTGLQGTPLTLDNAKVIKIDEKQYDRLVQGRRFGVYEVSYVVFPQKSGTLTIPEQLFSAHKSVGRSAFGRSSGPKVRLIAAAQSIEVLSPPSNIPANQWLPLSSLELSQSWGQGQPQFRVGEPITRTLKLKTQGVEAAFIAPTKMINVPGIRVYPEQPEVEELLTESGYEVTRTERFGLVPSQAGALQLPAIQLRWWDTTAKRERLAELPAEVIQVLPARGGSQPTATAPTIPVVAAPKVEPLKEQVALASDSTGNWLLWSNLIWAAVCALLALLWWRAKRHAAVVDPDQNSPSMTASSNGGTQEPLAFKALEQACASADLLAIRVALLRWLHSRFVSGNAVTPVTLEQLILETVDPTLKELLRQLDKSIYGGAASEAYPAKQLLQQIRLLRKSVASSTQQQSNPLPGLYVG